MDHVDDLTARMDEAHLEEGDLQSDHEADCASYEFCEQLSELEWLWKPEQWVDTLCPPQPDFTAYICFIDTSTDDCGLVQAPLWLVAKDFEFLDLVAKQVTCNVYGGGELISYSAVVLNGAGECFFANKFDERCVHHISRYDLKPLDLFVRTYMKWNEATEKFEDCYDLPEAVLSNIFTDTPAGVALREQCRDFWAHARDDDRAFDSR